MPWFIYILLYSDNSYYTGIAPDLQNRVNHRNSGKGPRYLLSKLPLKLIYSEEYPHKSTARIREI